ncbi:hypothetical protein [Nocardioides sp. cx-173]|uniref:hypothetical protein n=1 Tax=Nocardioides sp. cx-173 TaxID=2898796 RepID=UPI001E4BECCA|nr:hypothetical protein [Nocardioides sp. cx-173]MCD4523319.1 hypothetical protein [Nocardioides sp. cx-173]UGB42341.1 hypothetical protein LQ940_02155 [Nocardioides sp. cx-173]
MPPELIEVDVVHSYARRVGDRVQLVLTLPADTPLEGRRAWLRLVPKHDAEPFRVPTDLTRDESGWRLEAYADAVSLTPGLWRLWLRVGKGGPLPRLQALLLMSDIQPIALLPGPRTRTLMAEPDPR